MTLATFVFRPKGGSNTVVTIESSNAVRVGNLMLSGKGGRAAVILNIKVKLRLRQGVRDFGPGEGEVGWMFSSLGSMETLNLT